MSERRDPSRQGFTMVELIIVVVIIAVLVATALPGIARYMRGYEIRASADEIATQIQSARSKAISKNVNLGVVWMLSDDDAKETRWVIEDDQRPNVAPNWSTIAGEAGAGGFTGIRDEVDAASGRLTQSGQVQTLRPSVVFDSPVNCRQGGSFPTAAPNAWGLRFNRFGAPCAPGDTPGCEEPPTPPGEAEWLYVDPASGTSYICLFQPTSRLRRLITVSAGGRVRVEEGQFAP
jgi:prepilin-type N-terminal cleavage/methylation domain-containing protein